MFAQIIYWNLTHSYALWSKTDEKKFFFQIRLHYFFSFLKKYRIIDERNRNFHFISFSDGTNFKPRPKTVQKAKKTCFPSTSSRFQELKWSFFARKVFLNFTKWTEENFAKYFRVFILMGTKPIISCSCVCFLFINKLSFMVLFE